MAQKKEENIFVQTWNWLLDMGIAMAGVVLFSIMFVTYVIVMIFFYWFMHEHK